MKDTIKLSERIDEQREKCLTGNGWSRSMWRWFWVWRKDVHDATFTCFTAEEALRIEGGLQSSADCYPAPAAMKEQQQ